MFVFFSFQSLHDTFLRTVPSYSDQAYVWLGLLRHFRWNKVILLTSNDQDSRMIATKFTGLAERNKIKVNSCHSCNHWPYFQKCIELDACVTKSLHKAAFLTQDLAFVLVPLLRLCLELINCFASFHSLTDWRMSFSKHRL